MKLTGRKTYEQLEKDILQLREQLNDANETIDAIRSGQIDALIVKENNGHALYTLKTADQTYRMFIEKMPEGAVTLNSSGLIIYSNSKFASMVNRPLSEVIGHPFEHFISSEHVDSFRPMFRKSWNEDVKTEILLSSDKGAIPVQVSLTTLQLDEGVSLNIILTDLTLQKETQRELKHKNDLLELLNHELSQSNHDLQQFASVASHDLQEPLRKIQIFSKFLQEKYFETLSEGARHYVEKIIYSAQRMKVLIVDILNYSKLSSNHVKSGRIDLNLLINEILEDFEIKIKEKNASIMAGPLPVIEGNPGQMRQVFLNLLSNALKFSKDDIAPQIIISGGEADPADYGFISPPGKFYKISIKDNGIGFDEKYASTIFSLFEKLHSKDIYEGTGIGLAIAKKIIDKHNGFIIAKGEEGQGAEFIILLPLTQAR